MSINYTLRKICENTGFHLPVFFRKTTEPTILFLYEKIRFSKNPYSHIFYSEILCAVSKAERYTTRKVSYFDGIFNNRSSYSVFLIMYI